jgi:hypothetical protein
MVFQNFAILSKIHWQWHGHEHFECFVEIALLVFEDVITEKFEEIGEGV